MDCRIGFKTYTDPNSGCDVILNEILDINPYFLIREVSNKRDSGLYFIYDGKGRIVYIGEGKTIINWTTKKIIFLRACDHKQNKNGTELVAKYIKPDGTIKIVAGGLTKLESRILEALFIREELKKGRKLTQIGATEGDRDSLINKNRGMSDKEFNKNSKMFLKKK